MADNWYSTLPKKRSAAGVMLFNADGHLLIVKPSYKDHWSLPGGIIDDNESPHYAALREVKEEIGIEVQNVELRCMDYMNHPEQGESYQFIFDGGVLSEQIIKNIQLDYDEIIEHRFVSTEQAIELITPNIQKRLIHIFDPKNKGKFIYLEKGFFLGDTNDQLA